MSYFLELKTLNSQTLGHPLSLYYTLPPPHHLQIMEPLHLWCICSPHTPHHPKYETRAGAYAGTDIFGGVRTACPEMFRVQKMEALEASLLPAPLTDACSFPCGGHFADGMQCNHELPKAKRKRAFIDGCLKRTLGKHEASVRFEQIVNVKMPWENIRPLGCGVLVLSIFCWGACHRNA